LRAQVQHQRRQADSQAPHLQFAWFNSMKAVIGEIDEAFGRTIIPQSTQLRFLDVGCCPGGFSSYILSQYPSTLGTGLSLPVEWGGHEFLLEDNLRERYALIWGDVTQYQLGPQILWKSNLHPFPFNPEYEPGFHLVILDGHPLRSRDVNVHLRGDHLLISQLIIGMSTISQSGTVIMKLSKPERVITSQMLYMLDILCADIRTWKPTCMHAIQETFYVIARGFGDGSQAHRYASILLGLRNLWVELTGAKQGSHGRRLQPGDLDFIVDQTGILGYLNRLKELSQHLWEVQAQSLEGYHVAKANGF
ncbi:hypothetical protein FISHEDRAFT_36728, partial [Fistulina hepatica ATCC 64428]